MATDNASDSIQPCGEGRATIGSGPDPKSFLPSAQLRRAACEQEGRPAERERIADIRAEGNMPVVGLPSSPSQQFVHRTAFVPLRNSVPTRTKYQYGDGSWRGFVDSDQVSSIKENDLRLIKSMSERIFRAGEGIPVADRTKKTEYSAEGNGALGVNKSNGAKSEDDFQNEERAKGGDKEHSTEMDDVLSVDNHVAAGNEDDSDNKERSKEKGLFQKEGMENKGGVDGDKSTITDETLTDDSSGEADIVGEDELESGCGTNSDIKDEAASDSSFVEFDDPESGDFGEIALDVESPKTLDSAESRSSVPICKCSKIRAVVLLIVIVTIVIGAVGAMIGTQLSAQNKKTTGWHDTAEEILPPTTSQAPTTGPTVLPPSTIQPATHSPSPTTTSRPTDSPGVPTYPHITSEPTENPTESPSPYRTTTPTYGPTLTPTERPTAAPMTPAPTMTPTTSPTSHPTTTPTLAPTAPEDRLFSVLASVAPYPERLVSDTSNAAQNAALWLTQDPYLETYSDDRIIQRWGLLTYLYSKGDGLLGPGWMDAMSECNWLGVTCDEGGSVVTKLVSTPLFPILSTIPEEIVVLQNLTDLLLTGNDAFEYHFTGTIPTEIGALRNLRKLDLSGNLFTGEVPKELGQLVNLDSLYLSQNNLTGSMPQEVCDLGSVLTADCDEVECSLDGCCTRCCTDGGQCCSKYNICYVP